VTSVIGQDTARRLGGIATPRHPVASAVTVAREAAKGALARASNAKYAPHAANDVLWPSTLRSGQPVVEFLRSNPSWAGISVHDTSDGLGEVINADLLSRLLDRQAACILYTHLGKTKQPGRAVVPRTRRALDLVAQARSDGGLMVTTTRRLLDFCRARRSVSWTATADRDGVRIDVSTAALPSIEPRRLEGLTFYAEPTSQVRLVVDGRDEQAIRVNPPDHTGRPSVSIAWPRLSFPPLS
jgi:hypothetical protein